MICTSCFKEIPDTAKFCPYCGAAVYESAPTPKFRADKHRGKGGLVALIIALVAALAAAVYFIFFNNRIDPFKDLQITMAGRQGYGVVECEFGETVFEPFEKKLEQLEAAAENLSYDREADVKRYFSLMEEEILYSELLDSMCLTVEPNGSLSNGDKVTVTFSWDEETAKKLGLKVRRYEKTVTVSDLKDYEEVDFFKAYFTVTFENGTEEALTVVGSRIPVEAQYRVVTMPDNSHATVEVINAEELKALGYVAVNDVYQADVEVTPVGEHGYLQITQAMNIRNAPSTQTGKVVGGARKGDWLDYYDACINDGRVWFKIGENKWIAYNVDDGVAWYKVYAYMW